MKDVHFATDIAVSSGELTTAGLIAVILVIVLAIEQELLRASGRRAIGTRPGALRIAVLPLLVTFGVVVVGRFVELLP